MLKLGEKVYEYIKTCGLAPKKAKAIIGTSKILLEKYKGKVPKELKLLEELPGVGHKTASVVVNEFFHKPAFPVDTHIHRLAQRWGLTNGKSVKKTEEDLKKLLMKKIGATYTYKLFSMAERFVLLKDVMELSVLCVKVYILIEKLK